MHDSSNGFDPMDFCGSRQSKMDGMILCANFVRAAFSTVGWIARLMNPEPY